MDKQEAEKLLTMTKLCFPNAYKEMDELNLKMMASTWQTFFEDIPLSVMWKVIQAHALDNDFPPSIRQMREGALRILNPVSSLTSPEMAWETVIKKVRLLGRYRKDEAFTLLSDAERRTANALGWDRMCDCSDENLGYLRKEFINLYEDINSEHRKVDLMPQGMLQKLQEMSKQKQLRSNDLS